MRIAVVDPSLFTPPYTTEFVRSLVSMGHDVRLYTRPPRGDERRPASGANSEVRPVFYPIAEGSDISLKPLRLLLKGLEHAVGCVRMWRELRRWSPDVIHYQWLPIPVIDSAALVLLRRLAPTVVTVHDTIPYRGAPSTSLQNVNWHRALEAADALVVHTMSGRRRLDSELSDSPEIRVIPHPRWEMRPYDVEVDAGDGEYLLFFGMLKPYKGVDLLLEAYASLPREERSEWPLRIAGPAKMDIGRLRLLARNLGVEEDVKWDVRFVPDSEVPALMSGAAVVVFPYRQIDASGALLLAIGFGRPIVASEVGAFRETLADCDGALLTSPEEPQDLAAALRAVLRNQGRRSQMAREIRRLYADLPRWDDHVSAAATLYRELIEARGQQE